NIFADPKSAAGPLPFDDGLLKDYSVSLETTYEIFKDIYNTKLAESSKAVNDKTKEVETLRKEFEKAKEEQQRKETNLETAKQAFEDTEKLLPPQNEKIKEKKTEFANLLFSAEKAKEESVSEAAEKTEKEPSDLSKALEQFEKNKTDEMVDKVLQAFDEATVKKPNLEELQEKTKNARKELETEQFLLKEIKKQLTERKDKKEQAEQAVNNGVTANSNQESALKKKQTELDSLKTNATTDANEATKDQALADTCEAKEIKDSEFMLYPDLKKSFIENAKESSTFDEGVKLEWKNSARTFFQALATNTQGYKSYGGDIEAKAIGQLLGLDIGITNVNLKLEGNRMEETFGKTGGAAY
ncbi:MAG: hypothetical protein KKE46_06215, partial [Gammaproteobacteria bacterium]|nr:hypothetical protein [Gammaproteobacteria bacterium]